MESIGSNQISPYVGNRDQRSLLSKPVADRVTRAIHHRILLLHRPNAGTFHVLGATCNVYTVMLTATPTCTCPDRKNPCKHILFVLIRVLDFPFDEKCLQQRRLRPCFLYRLLAAPTRPDSVASFHLQQRFLQLFSTSAPHSGNTASSSTSKMENKIETEPTSCPICLDDINADESVNGEHVEHEIERALVTCRVCKNKVHEECMIAWRRSRGRRPSICVVCRARWRDKSSSKSPNVDSNSICYFNLAPYVEEEEDGAGTSHIRSSRLRD